MGVFWRVALKRFSVSALLLLCLVSAAFVVGCTRSLSAPNSAGSAPVVAHARFVYRDGRLLVPGQVNGTETFFAISNEAKSKIVPALLPEGKKISINIAGEIVELDQVNELGDHSAYDVAGHTAGGVIGLDVLRDYCLEIDFLRRQLSLVRGASFLKEDEPNTVLLKDSPWGLLTDERIPFIIDPGSPVSILPAGNEAYAAPPPVMSEYITVPGMDEPVRAGYTRIYSVRLSPVVALKKPTFAQSLDEAHPIQPGGRPYGIIGARNLRDFVVTMDYPQNRVKLARSAEIGAREVFISMMDDLQNLKEREEKLRGLAAQWQEAAAANGQTNVVELSRFLANPDLGESEFPHMDTRLQAARDREALGLFTALWVVLHEKNFPVLEKMPASMRRLEIAEARAPEEPFIQSKLAEVFLEKGDIENARIHAERALRVDAGYSDALIVMQKIAQQTSTFSQEQQIRQALKHYQGQ